MNCKRIISALLITGIVTALAGFTRVDDDVIGKVAGQLDKWLTSHPQEKVYLQLDKPYYATGDDIWFKAYVTVGSKHQLSALSRVLNVELIDDRDSVKKMIRLPLINGLSWGDFELTDSLKEGNYRIRAYTNWMRNAGSDYFFDKTITIANAISNNVFTKSTYTFNTQNGRQEVTAVISYTGLDGEVYNDKQVTYEVHLGTKTITRGRGQTDDKGNLAVSFINPSPDMLKSGRIVTELKLSDKKFVTKSVFIKATSDKFDLQFFPEGGNLVNGNELKVAFKAVGADGLGVAVKGVVTDDQNNQVATFGSTHLGMGVFDLKPASGKTYKARITYADGSENTVELPAAVNTGYALSIDNSAADVISVKIMPGPVVSAAPKGEVMSLVAQAGGVIYYAGRSKPDSKSFTANVPKSKFPSGMVQFTLFSSTGEPLNERLVFIQNPDQLKLDVSSETQVYAARQKVKIELNAKDKDEKPVVGSFSVAVTDETKVPADETAENTILSALLLTSDLRGYIESPAYYFTRVNEKTRADLDVLMLTQGYHRFEWKQVLNNGFTPPAYPPEKSLRISGRLKTLFGKPVAKGKVTLFTRTGGTFAIDTITDSEGRFAFNNLVFGDSVKFVIQARTAGNGKNVQIELDNDLPQKVGENKNMAGFRVNPSDGLFPYLKNSNAWYADQLKYGLTNHAIMLRQVEIKAKKNPAGHSANLNGPGNADQVLGSEDFAGYGCAQIADCLQGRLFGVRFMNGVPYLTGGLKRPMEIVLDGLSVDTGVFNNLNSSDIESIEVLKNIAYTSIYGGRGGSGVLVITTKRGGGNYSVQRYAPGIITYSPKGYYKARVFYSPQYDNPKTNTEIPDLRSTIYWKPNILTGKDGKASFEFFNADAKGTYRVVVEGIGDDGSLGRQVYTYKVE